LDLTLPQVLLFRRSIFLRKRADHETHVRLTEAAVKQIVANQHAAAGSKHGEAAAGKVNFLAVKKIVTPRTEEVARQFGGQQPLFDEEKMREIRRGRGERR
jgi:hypothetical protein